MERQPLRLPHAAPRRGVGRRLARHELPGRSKAMQARQAARKCSDAGPAGRDGPHRRGAGRRDTRKLAVRQGFQALRFSFNAKKGGQRGAGVYVRCARGARVWPPPRRLPPPPPRAVSGHAIRMPTPPSRTSSIAAGVDLVGAEIARRGARAGRNLMGPADRAQATTRTN